MKQRTRVISIFLHVLLLMVVYVFQGMILPYMRLYGFVPLLLPIAATGVAVCEGRDTGGIFGLFAGILCDVSFGEPAGVFTVLLTITGLIIGTLADTIITRRFATFLIFSAAVLAVSAFVQMFHLLFFAGVLLQPLISTAIRQSVYSILFAFPLWFFVKALGIRAQRLSRSGRLL